MTIPQRILLLYILWCVSLPPAPAAEPDWGDDKALPIPPELQGLWAKGRHCNDPRRQLHITKRTMKFGTNPPVRSYYSLLDDGATDYYGGIVPDLDDPSFMASDTALTYASNLGFLFDYGNAKSPGQIYYRCPTSGPRRR